MTPPAPSKDLADIGPENLWAVWNRTAEFLVALRPHLDPVNFQWVLASPGEVGLAEISEGYPTSLIAAVPLSTLRIVSEGFTVPPEPKTPGWVLAAFGLARDRTFSLVKDKSGVVRLEKGRRKKAGAQVLVEGSVSDFTSTLREGNRIIQEKDWKAIFDDARYDAQDGLMKWFYHQQNPEAAESVEELFCDQE